MMEVDKVNATLCLTATRIASAMGMTKAASVALSDTRKLHAWLEQKVGDPKDEKLGWNCNNYANISLYRKLGTEWYNFAFQQAEKPNRCARIYFAAFAKKAIGKGPQGCIEFIWYLSPSRIDEVRIQNWEGIAPTKSARFVKTLKADLSKTPDLLKIISRSMEPGADKLREIFGLEDLTAKG